MFAVLLKHVGVIAEVPLKVRAKVRLVNPFLFVL